RHDVVNRVHNDAGGEGDREANLADGGIVCFDRLVRRAAGAAGDHGGGTERRERQNCCLAGHFGHGASPSLLAPPPPDSNGSAAPPLTRTGPTRVRPPFDGGSGLAVAGSIPHREFAGPATEEVGPGGTLRFPETGHRFLERNRPAAD